MFESHLKKSQVTAMREKRATFRFLVKLFELSRLISILESTSCMYVLPSLKLKNETFSNTVWRDRGIMSIFYTKGISGISVTASKLEA